MAKAKAPETEYPKAPETEYPPEAEGSKEAAQLELAAAIKKLPRLEGDLQSVIAFVGLPVETEEA